MPPFLPLLSHDHSMHHEKIGFEIIYHKKSPYFLTINFYMAQIQGEGVLTTISASIVTSMDRLVIVPFAKKSLEVRSFFKRKIRGFLTMKTGGKDPRGKYDVCEYGVM